MQEASKIPTDEDKPIEWPAEPPFAPQQPTPKARRLSIVVPRSVLFGVGALILLGLSFYGGVAYQKGKATTSVNGTLAAANGQTGQAGQTGRAGQGGFGGRGGYGGQRAGGFGTVTAVSDSSITITQQSFGQQGPSSSGTSTTYSITGSTTVTDGSGNAASVSDIQTGDMVIIRTSGTTSTTATEIRINPTAGGPSTGGQQDSSGDTGDSADVTGTSAT